MSYKSWGAALLGAALMVTGATAAKERYDKHPPFDVSFLDSKRIKVNGKKIRAYNPKNEYNAFVNYELGMHCVGFEMSYCCVIPPYNSIQAQAVKSGMDGALPRLLTPDNKVKLYYYTKDNSYSEGN